MARSRSGSKIHLVVDRNGLPISPGLSAARLHDSQALEPLIRGIPPIRATADEHPREAVRALGGHLRQAAHQGAPSAVPAGR
jgi:hypothetical protein